MEGLKMKAGEQTDKTLAPMPKAVFFDWDGTLVNTLPGLQRAHNHVRTALGFDLWTEEEFHSNLRHSSLELYPRIYGERATQALETLYDFIDRHHLGTLEILPDAKEILDVLEQLGLPSAVVSNKRDAVLQREIKHLDWGRYFKFSVGAGIAGRDKPAGDPILYALEHSGAGCTPDELWYVGDTITDLEAAADAGCHTILITHGAERSAWIEHYQPLYVVKDCKELADLLRNYLVSV